jgi:hypothetical protein
VSMTRANTAENADRGDVITGAPSTDSGSEI